MERRERKNIYNEDLGSSASISLDQLSEEEEKVEKILNKKRKTKLFFQKATSSNIFEGFILFLIILSSIFLAVENPREKQEGTKFEILKNMDICMTAVFTLEVIVKLYAWGFLLNGKKSYFRSIWNCLDFIIVIFSLLSLFGSS